MAHGPKRGLKADIKGPLIIAVVLAVVAFFGVLVFATGGTGNPPQFRLALSVAGAVFVVVLVVCATLIIVEKPNDEELGEGTGINRRSADLYAQARARREAREKAERAAAERAGGDAAAPSETRADGSSADGKSGAAGSGEDEARYGQRDYPKDHN